MNGKSNKLSIITIAYNCTKDLDKTIRSVVEQTFKDIEYIIVDGGSTDGSLDVIKKYEKDLSKWVSEPDKGIYDAMNKGLKMSTGVYVLFLNAGDILYDRNTLQQVPFIKYPTADVFYGETLSVDDKGNELGLRPKRLPHNLNWRHFRNGMVVCHQSILVKRELAPEYNMDYTLSSDVEWVLKCLKKSDQIVFTGTIISRFLEGGASKQRHGESLKERFSIMKQYFGLTLTVWKHIVFIVNELMIKLGLKNQFRKNYL
ncbi:glycosyltransferase family 2 protein [uncultured Draconibacterium sp.]|uniref:glycosyltransferase family 2 protein n=1 Tax=uncultured Draconibacterium sp. TaxID=1573823 RepID=UPI0032177877